MTTDYVKNWFSRADEDLHLIEILLKEETQFQAQFVFMPNKQVRSISKDFWLIMNCMSEKFMIWKFS